MDEHGAVYRRQRRRVAGVTPLWTSIKATRNAGATALAGLLFHAPALERPYRTVAGACRQVPGVHTLFRETTDRLIRRLIAARREIRRVEIGPVTASLDVSHFTAASRHFAGVPYEPGVTDVLLTALQPGHVFVDIGANIGYFSVIAGMLVGETGRVVAFEPNADARARLERHVQLNGLDRRTVVSSVALGERDEESVDFFLSCCAGNDGCSSLIASSALLDSGTLRRDVKVAVPVRTFDTVATTLAIPRVDVMKIDVEGAELGVLAGMVRTLATAPPRRIVCETPWNSEAHRLLTRRGYRARVVDEVIGGTPNLLFEFGDS